MGTSNAKKSRRNTSGKAAAAKRQRRADRKAKGTATPSRGEAMIAVPIWQYPESAAAMAAQEPTLTYEQSLAVLLAHPVYVSKDFAQPAVMVPGEVLLDEGASVADFIGSFEEMRRRGVMTWDPATRVHHMTSDLSALEPK